MTAFAEPPQKAVPLLDTIAARSRPGRPDTIMAKETPAPSGRPMRAQFLGLPGWLVLGLVVRVLLVPFHHPWDLQTWYNMFVDLAHNRSPYETLRYLTYSTRAQWGLVSLESKFFPVNRELFYEYYAYPPLPLLLYYPFARLYAAFFPPHYEFVVQGALAAHRIPVLVLVLFKAPLFAADVGIALLLWRLTGEQRARTFFLNPFVILVSAAWMFEDLMTVLALLALYLAVRKRSGPAGFALALGTLTKWTPVVLWPVIGLWLLRQRVPGRHQLAFHGAFLLTVAVGLASFWDGVRLVAQFHALRPGANLTPHILLYVLAQFRGDDIGWYYHILSPYVGVITLPLALGAAYLLQVRRALPLPTAASLTVIAFFLGSKVVNEPYVCLLLPLLLWEEAERTSEAKKFVFKAAYALPLAYAILNVPIVLFLLPVYLQLVPWDPSSVYWASRALPRAWHSLMLATLSFAFVGLLVYAWQALTEEVRRETAPCAAYRPDPDRDWFKPSHSAIGQDAS